MAWLELICTHRGAVCVGEGEGNALGGVDHRGPGQLRSHFGLHVLLQVCIDFKDGFNPMRQSEKRSEEERESKRDVTVCY